MQVVSVWMPGTLHLISMFVHEQIGYRRSRPCFNGEFSGLVSIPGDTSLTADEYGEYVLEGRLPSRSWREMPPACPTLNLACLKRSADSSQPSTISLALRRTESLKLRPSLLKIIVDNNLIMHTRSLRVRNLVLSLLQTRQNRFLAVRSTASQPLLQDLDGRRLQEQEARVEIRLLDLLDTL